MNLRFRPFLRALTTVFVLALVAAACGGGGGDEPDESTTTAAPTTTRATTTTTTPPDGPIEPLTGLPIDEGNEDLLDQAAVVVKIGNNNSVARRNMVGLDRADVVFEERIEVDATRFAAIFHSDLPDYVGSIRSGRTSDIEIVANLRNPIFLYSGSNTAVARQLRDAEDEGVLVRVAEDLGNREQLFRDPPGSRSEHSLRANPESAVEAFGEQAGVPEPLFLYLRPGEAFEAGEPTPALASLSASPAVFIWDADAEVYQRYQGDHGDPVETATPLEMSDGEPIEVANVVVLFVNYTRSQTNRESVVAQTVGQGEALILSQGQAVTGTWARPFAPSGYALFDADGTELELTPGKTWVVLSPIGEAELWDDDTTEEFLDGQ